MPYALMGKNTDTTSPFTRQVLQGSGMRLKKNAYFKTMSTTRAFGEF